MANNSIPNGTKVRILRVKRIEDRRVILGTVKAQSSYNDEHVIVEWEGPVFPVSVEHVDELVEIK